MPQVIKRQPALIIALVTSILGWLVTQEWAHLSAEQSAALVAVVVALGGFVVGAASRDAWIGRLTGLAQAVVFASISFGWDVSQDAQQGLLGIVAAAGAVFIWDRNFPKAPPSPAENGGPA